MPNNKPNTVDLLPLLVCLLRGKRILALYVGVAIIVGLLASFLWPASYNGTTEILPPQQRPSNAANMLSEVSAGAAALAGAGSELQARSMAEMYVHMLQAQPVLDAQIARFNLMSVYRKRYLLDTRKALLAHTTITASKEGFIAITVQDRDNDRAAALANGYVEQLRNLSHRFAFTESSQRRVFYEAQLAKQKEDLAHAEIAFKSMQQNNRIISVDAQAKALIETGGQIRAQIAAKEVELGRLRGYATGNNPQVQIVEDELRAMRGQLAQAEAGGGGGYTGRGLATVPAAELDFVRGARELRYQEGIYELLLKQYESARVDEARDAPVVQVLAAATPAERPAWPKKSILLPIAALLGLLLGCARLAYRHWTGTLTTERATEFAAFRNAVWGWS